MFIKILIFFLLCSVVLYTEQMAESKNEKKRSHGIAGFPIVFYTPETRFAGGAAGLYYYSPFSDSNELRPNQVGLAGYYTQNKQYFIGAYTEQYYRGDKINLAVSSNFTKFPDKFWGIGADTDADSEEQYTPFEFMVRASCLWQVDSDFYIGPLYHFAILGMRETEEGGLLAVGDIPGSDGTRASGGGIHLTWDRRDNVFSTFYGALLQLKALVYREELGGGENFAQLELDYRQFFQLMKQHVFAVEYKMTLSSGTIPFQLLPRMGGSDLMRGYYKGRYRDKQYIAIQSEYRYPIFWRFRGVFFGAIGQVAPAVDEFEFDGIKVAGGAGIRFVWDKGQRINVRFDVGISDTGVEYYLNVKEAF